VIRQPLRPGQTVNGKCIVTRLDVGELVLLRMLYRLAARGAQAEGHGDLAAELARDGAALERHLSQRAALATGEVAGHG
jgi:hypothetical protein